MTSDHLLCWNITYSQCFAGSRPLEANSEGLKVATQPSGRLEGNFINVGTPDSVASGEAGEVDMWESMGIPPV
jgi:hypothetical protein